MPQRYKMYLLILSSIEFQTASLPAKGSFSNWPWCRVVPCLTGFRFSDFAGIQVEDFRDGMLHVYQKKTMAMVIVPAPAFISKPSITLLLGHSSSTV
jgi:hypothetical protein